MVSVDPRSEEFREAVASGGSFRNTRGWSLLPARGAQRGNVREFVVVAQVKGTEFETTDSHG
jgi:hypothetical protein